MLRFLMPNPDGSNPPVAHADNYQRAKMKPLTSRERQIALLVCTGLSNKQIAQRLDVTEGTVKVHLHNIYVKLAIRNRTMLALLVLKLGVTAPTIELSSSLLSKTYLKSDHFNGGGSRLRLPESRNAE